MSSVSQQCRRNKEGSGHELGQLATSEKQGGASTVGKEENNEGKINKELESGARTNGARMSTLRMGKKLDSLFKRYSASLYTV